MKKLLLTCMMIALAMTVSAQHRFNPEQFRAELHKRIAAEARLSQEEMEKFFPVYDQMKDKQRFLHQQMKGLMKMNPGSDAACRSAIMKRDKLELQMKKLEADYHERFMKILSPLKVYDIIKAEARFHRETFRRMAKRHD